MYISLEKKIFRSEHVLIVKVVEVSKTDKFPKVGFRDWVKEGIIIEAVVNETFKGNQHYDSIKIHIGVISATAGFTGYGIEEGNEYIAYLKEKDGFLTLSGFSHQYLEPINRQKNEANDLGQTRRKVKLDQKIKDIEKVIEDNKRHNKIKNENAASGTDAQKDARPS